MNIIKKIIQFLTGKKEHKKHILDHNKQRILFIKELPYGSEISSVFNFNDIKFNKWYEAKKLKHTYHSNYELYRALRNLKRKKPDLIHLNKFKNKLFVKFKEIKY